MLKSKLHDFYSLIENAQVVHGGNVPLITRMVIDAAFPETVEAADREGCNSMLYAGVKEAVSKYVRSRQILPEQGSFADVCEKFADYIAELKSTSYTVPSLGEAVSVERLVAFPDLLDEARKFMRQKGVECLAEAKRLDDLYNAVTSA
jgi:hypothetical protein